jgi:uncharacterized protein
MDREPPFTTVTSRGALELPTTGILAVVGRFADGPTDTPVSLRSAAEVTDWFGSALPDGDAALALTAFFANGGKLAYGVRVEDDAAVPSSGALLGSAEDGTGLHALTGLADVDLVCLPDTSRLDAQVAAELVADAVALCAAQHRFLLVDPPAEVADGDGVVDWVDRYGLRSPSAALYVPRLRVQDAANGGERLIPTSGAVAGVYARTDRQRGVWKAPAGTEAYLQGVRGVARELGRREQDELNPRGIDVLRRLPDDRIVVWGSRTLAGDGSDPEWRYVPVRRTAVSIERALRTGLGWSAARPNDQPLWTDIRIDVERFLDGLWREGALQGATPEQAYVVRCGVGATMTQADVDRGVVVLEVGIALVRPAEFIVLRIELAAAREPAPVTPPVTAGSGQLEGLGLAPCELAILRAVARRHVVVVGPARDGRRLVAEAMADEAGAPVFRVDLDAVVSRYIGETEKNLSRLFDRAEAAGAVLFFDEADALFGKRTEVADSDDRRGRSEAAPAKQAPRGRAAQARRIPDAEVALEAVRRRIAAYAGMVVFGVEDPDAAGSAALPYVTVPPRAAPS